MNHATTFRGRALIVVVLLAVMTSGAAAQNSQLGNVTFENSGAQKAQASFLRGLAALHSFWYEEALEAFREATAIDPDFMLGYWGQAMALNHPLWSEQDTTSARQIVAKFKDSANLSQRERDYLAAVRLLYGDGDKRTRDEAYSAAMEKIYRAYPNDLDGAAFYALSLLGIVNPEDKSYRVQARAGAVALEVYRQNPNHPGAAHYIIHAFDDPDHAILALPAALRYASIAPEAHHARHMPSHIFLQLGMWPEAATSNESAWEASETWMKRKNLSPSVRDYHSLHWLLYVYLQQGRYAKAEALLALMKNTLAGPAYENKLRPGYYENSYANMAAAFVVETERWELANKLFPQSTSENAGAEAVTMSAAAHGAHGAMQSPGNDSQMVVRTSNRNQTLPSFVRGMASAGAVSADAEPMGTAHKEAVSALPEATGIRELEIGALSASRQRQHEKAIALMKRATTLEEAMGAPSGPPGIIKPSHELFGEILLRAGKPVEAAAQFRIALLRQPNRARSLLGAARAARDSGNAPEARSLYAQLQRQWQQADRDLPELKEVNDYLRNPQP
jgi:Tfp pilus assembly protein PilF